MSTMNVLVVGGGGSGSAGNSGVAYGGGGGGGGYLEGAPTIAAGTHTVTIGGGGTAVSSNISGNNGTNSVFDTYTANGGGYGAATNSAGGVGGSGGGGGGTSGAAGTSNQSSSGSLTGYGNSGGVSDGTFASGGGGGAGGAGGTGSAGAGKASSISGSSVTYAAGATFGGTSNGAANTGNGGSGTAGGTSGAGGSGIVIISYVTANFGLVSITGTGNTLVVNGANTIATFIASGNFVVGNLITFLEPGGDADFLVGTTNGFWTTIANAPVVATDFVHGGHKKSIKYAVSAASNVRKNNVLADAGTRFSFYIYFVTLPNAINSIVRTFDSTTAFAGYTVRVTNTGVIQLWNTTTAQIGTNGATLSTGVWYRISLAYTITSTTVNRFELFVNGVSSISVTNATLTNINMALIAIGNGNFNLMDIRTSDHYIDNSAALTDTGDIWVTAKRPNANGTTNGFTTQIGSGGSGYGSGHSPQVNERALSTTNGWSMIGAGSAVTEEYSIESAATGDINISAATIVDYLGWVSAKSLVGETASIIVGGVSSNISLTSTITLFTKIAGSSTYPAGSTDIGIITTTALTTVSLYEAGVLVAFIPPPSASISQVHATLTLTGGTQTVATVDDVSIAQTAAILTMTGGTQTATTNSSIAQVSATLTLTGGTQAIASIQDVSIAQVGATLTVTGGTQTVQARSSISQVAATLTMTGGTQAVASANLVAITQTHAILTLTGGTQAVASIQDVSITQTSATLTVTGGTQAVLSVSRGVITRVGAATLTMTGGNQVVAAHTTSFKNTTTISLTIPAPLPINLNVLDALPLSLAIPSPLAFNLIVPSPLQLSVIVPSAVQQTMSQYGPITINLTVPDPIGLMVTAV